MSSIVIGDSLDKLKDLASDSIDFVCTDPPYGYSFMGKDWDKAVPSVEIWQECLRVLKPGAFACVMSAPRSDVQNAMISRLMEAGFRLDFTPIYWTYASGFPKAGNIGKLVDKRQGAEREVVGEREQHDIRNNSYVTKKTNFIEQIKGSAASPEAKALDGSYAGFQPKPAVEVIIVAMKPLHEKTYVDQALANGHGVSWLDDARIPTGETLTFPAVRNDASTDRNQYGKYQGQTEVSTNSAGRFPANLLVSDDVLNDGRIIKANVMAKGGGSGSHFGGVGNYDGSYTNGGDSGSYSKYFDLDKWASTLPFLITPKASKSEKNKGLDNMAEKPGTTRMNASSARYENGIATNQRAEQSVSKNHHPTVKPLKLMSYLITLFSRPGDTVLDPFVGSGTTVVAAKQLDRVGIGIEREAEYAEIARARLAHVMPQLPPEKPEPGLPPVTLESITKPVQGSLF